MSRHRHSNFPPKKSSHFNFVLVWKGKSKSCETSLRTFKTEIVYFHSQGTRQAAGTSAKNSSITKTPHNACVCQIDENLRLKALQKCHGAFSDLTVDSKIHENFVCREPSRDWFMSECTVLGIEKVDSRTGQSFRRISLGFMGESPKSIIRRWQSLL